MSAPSSLYSSLSQKLSASSQQLLGATKPMSKAPLQPVSQSEQSSLVQKANQLLNAITDQSDIHSVATSAQLPTMPIDNQPVSLRARQPLPPASKELSDEERLAIFDAALDQAEQLPSLTSDSNPVAVEPVVQAVAEQVPVATPTDTISDTAALFASVPPQALPQATEDLWQQAQPQGGLSGKEQAANWSIDSAVQESGGMLTSVETERSAEISPEVEKYLQRVERDQESPAEELAKLIPTVLAPTEPAPTEVARVLPVTKQMAAIGHKKSSTFSVRWLVEWSDKLIKMFRGKAVYRKPDSATS